MEKTRYGFLTLPNYSLIAVTNALEPLRMANRIAGRDIYEWSIVSLDGRPVAASSGLDLVPTIALDKLGKVETLFVCGGINVREAVRTAPLRAPASRRAPGRARGALYRRLRARARRAPRQLPRHDPLGESAGASRGVPAGAAQRYSA
jgi:transcriptional regulator GlxA family with amidase domain